MNEMTEVQTQSETIQAEPQLEQSANPQPEEQHGSEPPTTLTEIRDALMSESRNAKAQRDTERAEAEADEAEEAHESDTDTDEDEPRARKLPKSLSEFPREEVEAVLEKFGIPESQLKNKHVMALVAAQLEAGAEDTEEAETQEAETDESPEEHEQREAEENQRAEAQRQAQTAQARDPHQPPTQQEFEAHIRSIQAKVADPTINSPEMVEAFKNELRACFGADPSNPEAMQNVDRLANGLMIGAVNLLETYLPKLLAQYSGQVVNHALPGLQDMYVDSVLNNSWEAVARSDNYKGLNLPAYDTPEFNKLAEDLFEANPWFKTARFSNNFAENVRMRAELACKLISGEKVNPKALHEAFQKGKEEASRQQRKVSASRILGSGKSRGMLDTTERGSSLMDVYHERRGSGF